MAQMATIDTLLSIPTDLVVSNPTALAPIPSDLRFDEAADDFLPAADLADLAAKLIAHRATQLWACGDAAIEYRWKRKGGTTNGKATLGKCEKPGGLLRHFSKTDYVVWLAADNCRYLGLANWQLEALLAHELMHVGLDSDTDKRIVAPHDWEGFSAEIEIYGLWQADLEAMGRAVQLKLFGGEGR